MRSAKKPIEVKKSARTRSRILEATAESLSTRGYAATRLADIADIAEIQAPAIYYYFDSKSDLVEEVMRIGNSRTREHVEASLALLPDDTTPLERIDTAVAAHLEMALQLSHFATASIRNAGQVPPAIQHVQRREERRYLGLWRELVTAAQVAGEIGPGDLGAVRMFILGALNSAPMWWRPARGSVNDLITTAQRLVRASLDAAPSQVHVRTSAQ